MRGFIKRTVMIVSMVIVFQFTAFILTEAYAGSGKSTSSTGGTGLNAQYDEEMEEDEGFSDPVEPWNRMIFTFNDRLYFWVLKPAARGYAYVIPEGIRISVRNVFRNITTPVRFLNSLLQGKIEVACIEAVRFGINTTVGAAGIVDVAREHFGLQMQDEDLGQTLGFYGLNNGFYIVWPFLGPSSLRDSIGLAGDYLLDPMNHYFETGSLLTIRSYESVNKTSLRIGEYEDMIEASLDPYTALRDAYFQYRSSLTEK